MKSIPKVELHCHLDGSVSVNAVHAIYEYQGNVFNYSEEILSKLIVAPEKCKNLNEYLKCFPIINQALTTKIALQLALFDLVYQAVQENVVYLEIRFSPKHLESNLLEMEETVEVLCETKLLLEKYYKIGIGFILCCMKGQSIKTNKTVLSLAKKYLNYGVVAIDLAGNESKYPIKDYQWLFKRAEDSGIPFTIHAGETGSVQNVIDSANYGAFRIGHGIAAMKSIKTMQLIVDKGIMLEMCPVSNIQTGACKSWEEYPVLDFLDNGIDISINTDNRTVSNTSLSNEWIKIDQHCFDVSSKFILEQNLKTVDFLFTTESQKQWIKKRMDGYGV